MTTHPPLLAAPRRRQLLQGLAAFAVAPLVSRPAAAAEQPVKELRIAAVSYVSGGKQSFAGSIGAIVQDGGLERALAQRGVALKWVPVSTAAVGPQVNEAFSNHGLDFAAYGDLPSIILNASGVRTRLLVPGSSSNTYLVVPSGSPARSIRDLKGKRIALMRGRPWEYPFVKLLEANGMSLADVRVVNLNPQAGAAALGAGGVDAFFTLLDAYLLVDKGLGRIIWDSKSAPASWQMRSELWGDQRFVAAHPELAQLVVDAFVANARWASDPANRANLLRMNAASGIPESVVRRDYENLGDDWRGRFSPRFDAALSEHYRGAAAHALKSALIADPVDIVGSFEPRFVDAALASQKLLDYWRADDGAARR